MDEPQHHEVGRDAQEHVDELQAQVTDENSRHGSAGVIHRQLEGAVYGSVGDEEQGGVDVGNLHDGRIRGPQRSVNRTDKNILVIRDNRCNI